MQRDDDGLGSGALLFEADALDETKTNERTGRTERLAIEHDSTLALVLDDGSTLALDDRTLLLGRARHCDLCLLDRSVSAEHARIVRTESGWEIHDQQSTNGTWVDGVRVRSARLRAGIELALGRSVLRCTRAKRRASEPLERDAVGATALFGSSDAMTRVRREVGCAAATPYAVLIQGESGSGKELVAQAVHLLSARRRAPFVALNAGAIPESLVESELFGHERGAFTGANARRRGAFEQAEGGVLFLDEVGELPLAQQAKLLRVLETLELRRLGSEKPITVNVKVVCATHRDLRAMVAEGLFREDLLYRIEQHTVRVPPLRERMEDLPSLAKKLCERVSIELGRPLMLEPLALRRLLSYEWPGNVRELLGVLRSAAARAPDMRVGPEHLGEFESRGRVARSETPSTIPPPAPPAPAQSPLKTPRESMPEGAALWALYDSLGRSLSALARVTGRSRSALRERLRKAAAGSTHELGELIAQRHDRDDEQGE